MSLESLDPGIATNRASRPHKIPEGQLSATVSVTGARSRHDHAQGDGDGPSRRDRAAAADKLGPGTVPDHTGENASRSV